MSKRPKTAGSFLSRLRRPASRLRDMPIWSKLGLIMIVPTIATVVVGTSGLVDHVETLNNANRAGDLANLSSYSGSLVDSLQDERTAAVLLLGADGTQPTAQYQEAYNRVTSRVDRETSPYRQQRAEIEDLPGSLEGLLDGIDQNLQDLSGIRSQVFNGKLALTETVQAYEGLISDLLAIRDSATQLAGNNELSDRMRAAAAVAREKEFLAARRVVVHRALGVKGGKRLTPALRTDYIASGTGQQQALQSFKAVATPDDAKFHDQTVAGGDRREAQNYTGWIDGNTTGDMRNAPFGPDQWEAAMTANAKLIRNVETKLDGEVVDEANSLRSDVQRQVFLETGLLLSMLLLAILFAYLVARSMARSLRELRQGALSVAQYGLPQAVARLRDPQVVGQLSPVQLANQIAEPLPVRSRDEFGQVTEAFNAVHLEAVRTAAEQAALRASVATMFVNLARRSQILVDRLIGHLDRLERGEEDPDRLAELFQLDHLATRMRRNDENLLVLAGADSTRVQREPAALIDVLRAAQSEVEHYTRIEFGVIDRDIEVAAHAVNDLVHLVAELFDNATAFSPPDSQVMVEARRVGDRSSLYVEDRGIGISAEQLHDLNERLATPPQVDVAVSRMMGLVVVARLASRHGVRVELRPGSDRGTVADVTLPTSVLVPRALSGRVQQPPALPAAGGPQQNGPAPAFGALPALGNGPRPSESGNQVTLGGRPFEPASRNGAGTPPTPVATARCRPGPT
ncbi:sensor histidine kinase [Micromonospora zamorensis]|uniref:sensor histidine kinase n=1 Tax=Micromonospora zamorensis TaxID=709883 RepID=UPI0008201621|nr:sensor histidine kinase [Micromonospora zamorensis]SCG34273.1 Signal transduction histidine kinase [Micromonospora zamorensis]